MRKNKSFDPDFNAVKKSEMACAVYTFEDNRVVTVAISEGFCRLLGIDEKEDPYVLMDNDMYRDTHPDDVAFLAEAALKFATEGGSYNVIYRTKINGKYEIIHAIGEHVYLKNGNRYALVLYSRIDSYYKSDSSSADVLRNMALKAIQDREVEKVKSYDELTGLPSMNYFFELLRANFKKRKKSGKANAVLFFDLCGMKVFNQQYGFTEGDKLIVEVSKILKKHFSNENCCRLFADRFVAFTGVDNLDEEINAILSEIKAINKGNTLPVKVGVFNTNMGRISATVAVDRAKIACDSIKNIYESNVVYFDKKMLEEYNMRNYVINNLNTALEKGYIKVFIQPVVRTASRKICDEEALSRWEDPDKGMIMPSIFIPILEDARLVYRLDLYVTKKIVDKLVRQKNDGIAIVPVSINLSRSDFYSCNIVDEIVKIVDEKKLEHKYIIIEITESVICEDKEYMKSQIERFRELGFKVWMDDFGSGYSSPDILQRIHFDAIKIDKMFVDELLSSSNSSVVVNELIKIANYFGSETVAEGVESKEQVDFLAELGCGKLQGYYFVVPHDIEKLFSISESDYFLVYENIDEADYYSEIGKVNLYDMAISSDDKEGYEEAFDTLPMVIIQVEEDEISVINCNKPYRKFMDKFLPNVDYKTSLPLDEAFEYMGVPLVSSIIQCGKEGKRVVVDVKNAFAGVIHLMIKSIAHNQVTGSYAIMIIVLGYESEDEASHKKDLERIQQERRTYSWISALSGNYICMYSIDPDTANYVEYNSSQDYSRMNIPKEGEDFFTQPFKDELEKIYSEDREYFAQLFTREKMFEEIENKGIYELTYRTMIDGVPRYTCMKATLLQEDNVKRIIAGIVDVDSQVKREQEYYRNLSAARKISNLDVLTGIKNKKAYSDLERELNSRIKYGEELKFAIAVFDINDLKYVNDTRGHKAGDAYIKKGCQLICRAFKHSPIFRVGGDEFVALIQGEDIDNADKIMQQFREDNGKRNESGEIVIASGLAYYEGEKEVSTVFDKADAAMYLDKQNLKNSIEDQ